MRLSKVGKPKETFTFELRHYSTNEVLLDENDKPITIEVYGRPSKFFRKMELEFEREQFEGLQNRRRKRGEPDITIDEVKEKADYMLASSIKSWTLDFGNGVEPLDVENVLRIFEDYYWIKEQIDYEVNLKENFYNG